jgi:hypothetical protein
LLTQFIFVVEDSTDDEIVTANDDDDGNDVDSKGSGQNVGLVVHIGGYSIERTPCYIFTMKV